MGTRINVYICDDNEREIIKMALAAYRSKVAGLTNEQIRMATEIGLGNNDIVAKPSAKPVVNEHGWVQLPKNSEQPPVQYWVSKIDRLWSAGLPRSICEELNDISHCDVEEELKKRGYIYKDDIIYEVKNTQEVQPSTLPSNEEREIPFQLKRFIDEGWHKDIAFRIYDEWQAEMKAVSGTTEYVKPLSERFMEERMKRDADENSK